MDKLGLGYDVLKEINPGLIYGALSGFGSYGPYSQRPGYDIISQGMLLVAAGDDDPSVLRPVSVVGRYGSIGIEIVEKVLAKGIPAAPIFNVRQITEDEHIAKAREMF